MSDFTWHTTAVGSPCWVLHRREWREGVVLRLGRTRCEVSVAHTVRFYRYAELRTRNPKLMGVDVPPTPVKEAI